MKPPKPRLHMLDLTEPLISYTNVNVRCGITLKHALPILSLREGEEVAVLIPAYRECRDCAVGRPENLPKYWRYWLIEGAENLGASEGDNEP